MTLVYLILAHKNPKQVRRLIDRLTYKDEYFIVHVDKKTNITPFIKEFTDMNNTTLLPEELRVDVGWGQFSMVEATLNLMKWSLKVCETGVSILLSGQDYPIKSNQLIHNFFDQNCNKSFIHGIKIPNDNFIYEEHFPYFSKTNNGLEDLTNYHIFPDSNEKWFLKFPSIYQHQYFSNTNIQNVLHLISSKRKSSIKDIMQMFSPRKIPKNFQYYRGSQWWSLNQNVIKTTLKYLSNNAHYLNFHKYTFAPDEVFFQSIIFNKFDTNIVNQKLVYIDWSGKDNQFPYIFKDSDIQHIIERKDELWARKFDCKYNCKILDLIDQLLLN